MTVQMDPLPQLDPQPVCEACFLAEYGAWASIGEDRFLVHAPTPETVGAVRKSKVGIEDCSACGGLTIAGIYVDRLPLESST